MDSGAIDSGAIDVAELEGAVEGTREAAGELPLPLVQAATTNRPARDIAPIRDKRI
jgi:hypothetical protein